MANIKRGFKRIDRVLLVLVVVVFVGGVVLNYPLVFWIPICFAPYLIFKFIYWIVMGFLDDDEVKDKEK